MPTCMKQASRKKRGNLEARLRRHHHRQALVQGVSGAPSSARLNHPTILRSGPFPSASSNRACRRRASSVCPRAGSVLKHFAFCPLLNRHPRTRRRVRDPRVRRGLVRKLAWNPYLRAPGPSLSTARSESDPMQLRMQLIFIADRKQPLRLAEAELFGRPDHYLVAAN